MLNTTGFTALIAAENWRLLAGKLLLPVGKENENKWRGVI
jgi:hypothetical protein